MPSIRENGPKVTVAIFDVIGADGKPVGFIRHTGLASKAGEHDHATVDVSDMGPPMGKTSQMRADTISTTELTEGEARKIKDFIDRHQGEHQAIQQLNRHSISQTYCILPHAIQLKEQDDRYVRMRFSCAGFVFEAYKRARIIILVEPNLPAINLDQIKKAYPDYSIILDRSVFRESMGLVGLGPWPVMLCGYLVNALNRTAEDIRRYPYVVNHGDEIFQGN